MQMALKIFLLDCGSLCLVTVTESGTAIVQALPSEGEHRVWSTIYSDTMHTQPALGIDVAFGLNSFYTCGADSVIARHPLPKTAQDKPSSDAAISVKTGHAGQQGLSVRGDERILATAGWDSRIRVYSAKTLKELAVLKWHKEGCYAVSFGHIEDVESKEGDADAEDAANSDGLDAESTALVPVEANLAQTGSGYVSVKKRREQKVMSTHWIAAGSKDGKVSLWEVF
jgi:ASTRA-associated protein 1